MDPNEILSDIRELIAQDVRSPLHRDDVGALISRVEALDEWITSGGFLPADWERPTGVVGRRKYYRET